MPSTIDFSTLTNDELLYGYQRVNRSRFPENFVACTEEIAKRGLEAPEKFEICPIGASALGVFRKFRRGLSTLAQIATKKQPTPEI